jgi:outer membrane protein assembly factor BamB
VRFSILRTKCVVILILLYTLSTGRVGWTDDWPQFRGPARDGKSAETGLLKKWPEGGPGLLWSVEGLGIGYSSVAVADGFVYTTGMLDGEGFLFAYDLNGNLKWKESYGPEWTGACRGARTTPTVDTGKIYMYSGTGVMVCFNAKTGKKIWDVDTLKEFEAKNIQWGMTGSPLIDGDKVYCTPGGNKGTMVALNKITGETIWATTGLSESSAYSSPILFERGGRRLLATMIQKSVICVSTDDGALIWRVPYEVPSDTGTITPIYHDGGIYFTCVVFPDITSGGTMFKLSEDGTSVKQKWHDETLDCQHGGVVLVNGYLYGTNWYNNTKGNWICLDWDSGKVMYNTKWNGHKGSVIYADGMLYCYEEITGEVGLVKASPKGFDVDSSFHITQGSGYHWAHPAISDARLFIRHGDALMAYNIKSK